jgi:pantoate kinase
MASASAFCPGHITAFFEIVDAEEALKKGSRGVGFCISKGVVTQVNVKKASEQNIEIRVNGKEVEADTTELVARIMLKAHALDVKIDSKTELPVSQGFGMSGAGALSTALALNKAAKLNISKTELVSIAHVAEVEALTGLGDVYPQSLGGLEMRVKPGAPPHGEIVRKRSQCKLVLCVLGDELETKDVISRPLMRKKISEIGRDCIEQYQNEPSWSNLFKFAKRFALFTELGTQKTMSAMAAVEKEGGMAAMSMLGNSIFASGDVKKLVKILKDHGEVVQCDVENRGARLIQRA